MTDIRQLRDKQQAQTGNVPATTGKKPIPDNFPGMLEMFKGEVKRALPAHLNADRVCRIALTCFRSVPKLAECDPRSVFAAVIQASQLGLEPGLLGQAYLIPFKNSRANRMECQLVVGYQGLLELVRRSGLVTSIEAHAVYTQDEFELSYGLNPNLVHRPNFDAESRGDIRLFYAVAHFKDGGTHVEVMSAREVNAIRDRSQNVQTAQRFGKKTPWDTDYEQMGIKTILRRIAKFLPKSPELAYALAMETRRDLAQPNVPALDDAIEGTYAVVEHDDPEVPGADDGVQEGESLDKETGEVTKKPEGEPVGAGQQDMPPQGNGPGVANKSTKQRGGIE